jgi:CRP-like cAMP-binding protein
LTTLINALRRNTAVDYETLCGEQTLCKAKSSASMAKEDHMGRQAKGSFDPKMFLAKVGAGKAILEFRKNQGIFAQGDIADAVFYIQKGRVKLTVVFNHGKEAVVAILDRAVLRRRLP